jgi:hypothetical protein
MTTDDLPATSLSAADARRLTDRIKAKAADLWADLLLAYRGGAHLALGYRSWGDYFAAEFGQSGRHGYRLLEAARVAAELEQGSTDHVVTEAQARALAPLLDDPDAMRAVYEQARAEQGDSLTAADLRVAVQQLCADPALADALLAEPSAREAIYSAMHRRHREQHVQHEAKVVADPATPFFDAQKAALKLDTLLAHFDRDFTALWPQLPAGLSAITGDALFLGHWRARVLAWMDRLGRYLETGDRGSEPADRDVLDVDAIVLDDGRRDGGAA